MPDSCVLHRHHAVLHVCIILSMEGRLRTISEPAPYVEELLHLGLSAEMMQARRLGRQERSHKAAPKL